MAYVKVFDQMLHSTIWREDSDTRVLWVTLLMMADQDGYVHASIPGLADIARISLEKCRSALKKFQQPDPDSTGQEEEGRRLQRVEGGWRLVNHDKFRDLMSREDRLAKQRKRQKRYMQNKQNKETDASADAMLTHADAADVSMTPMTTSDTDTDTDASAFSGVVSSSKNEKVNRVVRVCNADDFDPPIECFPPLEPPPPRAAKTAARTRPTLAEVTAYCQERNNSVDPGTWFDHYSANGWKVGRNPMKDWKASVRYWEKDPQGMNGNGRKLNYAEQRFQDNVNALNRVFPLDRNPDTEASRSLERTDARPTPVGLRRKPN